MGKELIWQCYTDDEHESVKLMENRFNSLNRPYALYLEGELGAGKTFLCQQIAKLNGIEPYKFFIPKFYNTFCKSKSYMSIITIITHRMIFFSVIFMRK